MNITIEWCPHCDTEVEIPVDKPSACPSCGMNILPCSACQRDLPMGCDWGEETSCTVFPTKGGSQ